MNFVPFFQEIDHKSIHKDKIVKGIVQLHSAMAKFGVNVFLSGLNLEFD